MLKQSLEIENPKKVYRRPNIYRLGSLEKVQWGQGNQCDGPECPGYYYG